MKKLIIILVAALAMTGTTFAQTASELSREQQSLEKILRKSAETKPTKEAKKEAKRLSKEGWQAPAGSRSIEQQLTQAIILGEEYMTDVSGTRTPRFLSHTALATAGTYNTAYAAARSNAMTEIAAMLETELAAAIVGKLDNSQTNAESAFTSDEFNQRMKSIIHQSLTNAIPVISLYRRLPNKNFEVQVGIAFDKQEVSNRIKRQMQEQLREQGDQLMPLVDEVLNRSL